MEVGNICERTIPIMIDAKKLAELIQKHPDCPVVILNRDFYTADNVYGIEPSVEVGEVLDCKTPWWPQLKHVSRKAFENYIAQRVQLKLISELGRLPSAEEEFAAVEKVIKAHRPYWKKCIIVRAGEVDG